MISNSLNTTPNSKAIYYDRLNNFQVHTHHCVTYMGVIFALIVLSNSNK